MLDFLNETNEILNQLINAFSTSDFLYPAKLIAALGALIAVFMIYKNSVTNAEKIEMNEVWRISALFIGIMFYGTFIKMVNVPLNLMSSSISHKIAEQTDDANNYFTSYHLGIDETNANEDLDNELNGIVSEVDGSEAGAFDTAVDLFTGPSLSQRMDMYIAEAIFNIMHFLGVIAVIILNVVRSFFLIVLTYFGIFVLAFSVYPGMKNSFFQWLQKYINVYLWLPIATILQGIISKLFTIYVPVDTVGGIPGGGSIDPTASGGNAIIALIGVCSLVAFATVPTMSSWLINAATSNVGSKLKQKGQAASGSISKGAKGLVAAKTGGASAVVKK